METKVLADQGARDRARGELDTTFLVEAAAGTGKTTILVERILAILKAGQASLREIAAITFTEKAAGDLKLRLRHAVEDALRAEGPAAPPALRAALEDLEAMPVNTIHGFCGDLIRERPVEAGVEPGFAVADALEASLIFEAAWEEWLAEQMAAENPAIRRGVEMGILFEAAGQAESPVYELAWTLIENRDALSIAGALVEPPWPDEKFAEAANAIPGAVAELAAACGRDCAEPDADRCAQQIAALSQWAARFGEASSPPRPDFDAVRAWLDDAPRLVSNAGAQKNWRSNMALKAAKEGCVQLKEQVELVQGEAAHRVIADLAEWLRPFLARYAEVKAQHRALDFMDLLIRARDVLRDKRAVREYFKSRFRFVLVDEFQDTDPLQAEIVFFLSERPGERAAAWEQVNLVPGKLFIVGDPKQSIYRFRRADLDLYGKVRAALSAPAGGSGKASSAQGETLQLTVNFRTVPRVVNEINPIFENLMRSENVGRFEPSHAPLHPNRCDESSTPCVLLPCPPPELRAADLTAVQWREKEAGCIAALIRDLKAGKVGGRKPVEYRDIAVLYRATTGVEALENALRAHDVKYQVSGGRRYYARREFQDLLAVLKAVDNPYDPLSIVGALRSPFFGQSDEDLLEHFAAGGAFNYLLDVPAKFAGLGESFAALKRLHNALRREPIPAVIARLFEETQALQVYAMKPHGSQRVANLLKVQDIARALAGAGVASPSALVRWLGEMEGTRQAEEESPIAEPQEDFVQLMTIHKAKGLEFKAVILANMGTQTRESAMALLDRESGRLQLNLGEGKKTRGWEAAWEGEKSRAEYELRRLFYVALTRAKDLLVMPAYWAKNSDSAFLKYLKERYPQDEDAGVRAAPGVEIITPDQADLDKRIRDTPRMGPSSDAAEPPEAKEFARHHRAWEGLRSAQAAKLSAGRRIQTGSGLVDAAHAAEFIPAPGEGGARGLDFGSLVHRIMETVDFRSESDLTPRAEAAARDLGMSSADARQAADLVRRALALPLLARRAAGAQEACREVPFAFAEAGTLYEGYADLVFLEDGAPVIVDYKTDSVAASEAPERAKAYAPQAEVYCRGIAAALGRPVKEFHFLFLRPGVAVPAARPV